MKTAIVTLILLLRLGAPWMPADTALPRIAPWADQYAAGAAPSLMARTALLMDAETGSVLYEKDADAVIPPASLTKVVAMHVVFQLAARGEIDLDETVALPPESWAVNMPPGSSLMFLGPGQEVSVRELMLGLAVSSGNDAAIALARHVAGSVEAFAALMTVQARALGLPSLWFEEPSGLSARNQITAREFAQFLRHYVALWPEAMREYHSLDRFTWPPEEPRLEPEDATGNRVPLPSAAAITQHNRNSLLQSYPGVDGIKTGFIRQSRYNLAATAQRDGRRLIAVLLGVPGETHAEGERNRARDATALLDYGFEHFRTVELALPPTESVRVWKGTQRRVGLVSEGAEDGVRMLTVAARDVSQLTGELTQRHEVEAPVVLGQQLGTIRISAADTVLLELPLRASSQVPRGNLLRVIWDSIIRFVRRSLIR
ncbi:MAG: D-alanyl-D-alanine carboxypeptidase [Spirochaetaceae bacterium]|nr:MAG: D-alanyl-D-alanine carboxypeptidase [Spirochaetaceae bacterium]